MGKYLIKTFSKKRFLFLFIQLLFPTIILAQVIIKDEIDLTAKSDYIGTYIFTLPDCNGTVQGDMAYWNAGARKKHPLQINDGFEIVGIRPDGTMGAFFRCGNGNDCAYCWDNIVHEVVAVNNWHSSIIMASLSKCVNGGTPVLVPLYYESFTQDNLLKYNVINSETNLIIGTIWFEPESCSGINMCQAPLTNPAINLLQIPDPNICNEITNDIPAGAFKGLYWSLREGEEFTLSTCQDQMTGNVKFIYSTNYTQDIDLPYNLELCPDRISNFNLTRIDDLEDFENYLIQINTEEQACALRQMVIDFKGIDNTGQQTGGEILHQDGIWLTEHTSAHENQHKYDYEYFLTQNKKIFSNFYMDYSVNCSTYTSDPENAKLIASNEYMMHLMQFSSMAKNEYENNLDEIDLNGRPSLIGSVEPYLDKLDNLIKLRWGWDEYKLIKNYCN